MQKILDMEFDKIYTKVNKRGGIKSTDYYLLYRGCMITVTDDNIHIECSYRVGSKKDIIDILKYIIKNYPTNKVVENRSLKSMYNEWIAHNNLYKLGLWRSHTISVDLNYPQEWYIKVIYWLLSRIVL